MITSSTFKCVDCLCKKRAFLTLLMLLFVSITAHAKVIYVNPDTDPNIVDPNGLSWSNGHRKIAQAVAQAEDNDQIWVKAGIYLENDIEIYNAVTIMGGFAGDETSPSQRDIENNITILDGQESGRGFYNYDNFTLEDFVIQNCKVTEDSGAGIFNTGTEMIIRYCTFKNNVADRFGGAICNYRSGQTAITGSVFIANESVILEGGAVYSLETDISMRGCGFYYNKAPLGGAVRNHFTVASITICDFLSNESTEKGGAISNKDSVTNIEHSRFYGNVSELGAAISSKGFACSTYTYNNVLVDNTAGTGGAIYNDQALLESVNDTITANSADTAAGIFNGGTTGVADVTNGILWANSDNNGTDYSAQITSSAGLVSYSCIQGGGGSDNNIGLDPMFTAQADDGGDGWADDPDTDQTDESANDNFGNYKLLCGSPCVDAGDNTAVPPGASQNRFLDDWLTEDTGNGQPPIVDMGAFEFEGCPGQVHITNPESDESIRAQSQYTIQWQSGGGVGDILVEFSDDLGETWQMLTSQAVANNGSYTWDVPKIHSDTCLIKIQDVNDVDITDTSLAFSVFDPNAVKLIYPDGGQKLPGGKSLYVTWENSGQNPVKSEYRTYNQVVGWSEWNVIEPDTIGNTAPWTPLQRSYHTVQLRVSDAHLPDAFDISDPLLIFNCHESWIQGDFNGDCVVDLADLVILNDTWQKGQGDTAFNPVCDISIPQDDRITMSDFLVYAANWLKLSNSIGPDLDHSSYVDMDDMAMMFDNWLAGQTLDVLLPDAVTVGDRFGFSLDNHQDTAAIGAWTTDRDKGTVYIYKLINGQWQKSSQIVSDDVQNGDLFGSSVAVDGDYILVGAYGDDNDTGSAYLFGQNDQNSVVGQIFKINASDSQQDDLFGISVAIDAKNILIGAQGDDQDYSNAGSVYAYRLDENDNLADELKITAVEQNLDDFLGCSVAIDGQWAFAGAYGDDDMGENSGAVYVCKQALVPEDPLWVKFAKLTDPNGTGGENFGFSIAAQDGYMIIGAKGDNFETGSAFIYKYDQDTEQWMLMQKLTPFDGQTGDQFGWSVDINADYAIVGSQYNQDTGSAYLYFRNNDVWEERAKLYDVDALSDDRFGSAVSLDSEFAFIGANFADTSVIDSGLAYVFSPVDFYSCDMNGDYYIDFADFVIFAQQWIK